MIFCEDSSPQALLTDTPSPNPLETKQNNFNVTGEKAVKI